MSAFDIGGRIVIDGDFDATFDQLEMRAEDAARAMEAIEMPAPDDAEIKAVIEQQLAQVKELQEALENLRLNLDSGDADQEISALQKKLDAIQEKLASGQQLTADESGFLAGAGEAITALGGLKGGLAGAAGKAVETASALAAIGKVALGVAGSVAAAGGMILGFVKDLGMMGVALLETERSFEALSNAKGVDSGALLAGLEEASRGAVDAAELMQQANKALLAGAEKIAADLPGLYDIARASAQLTGRDVAASFQGITQSVLRLDEAGLRAQGILVNLSEANREWAEANGRTVGTLSELEKQQIAANAAIAAAAPLMRDMGLEGETAAEKLAKLPGTIAEIRSEIAKAVASGDLWKALMDFVGGIGDAMDETATQMIAVNEFDQAKQSLEAAADELERIGESDAATKARDKLKALEAAFNEGLREWEDVDAFVAGVTALTEEADRATSATERLVRAQQLADNPELFKAAAFNAAQAAEATSTFAAALDRAREAMVGVGAGENQFASVIAQAEDAMRNMPEMPDISVFMDTDKLRQWAAAWAEVNPKLTEAHEALLDTADALDANRAAILTQAGGIDDLGERLKFLARAFLGSEATIDDLAASLGKMPPELLAAIGPTEDLALAIANLRAVATEPITIDVALRNLDRSTAAIEDLAATVAGRFGLDKARAFYESAIAKRNEFWGDASQDPLGARVMVDQYTKTLNEMVALTDPALAEVQESFGRTFDIIGMSVGELRGKIESALMEGSTVTAEDMARTIAGTYEDAPLEAARRLDAIAARGFAELQAHPDWAALLEIPADVLSGSEQALKDWARNMAGSVRNLERPDLIDWDAFAANFEAQLDREAAKEVTIDVALGELDKRGLLSGSPEERRQKVIEALGLEAPKLTFDALFKAEAGAGQRLQEQVGPITLEAALELIEGLTPEDILPEGFSVKVPASLDTGQMGPPTEEEAASREQAAGQAAFAWPKVAVDAEEVDTTPLVEKVQAGFLSAYRDTFDGAQIAGLTAAAILAGAENMADALEGAGGVMGDRILVGVNDAVANGAQDIIDTLAKRIAPSVEKIMRQKAQTTGGAYGGVQ